jgi:glycosidase
MQWDKSANAGFSSTDAGDLYLPVNTDPGTPDAETQMHASGSLWRHVHDLIRFRREHSTLRSDAGFRFLSDGTGYPLVFERFDENEHLIIAFNPSSECANWELPDNAPTHMLISYNGATQKGDREISLPPCSYSIIEL